MILSVEYRLSGNSVLSGEYRLSIFKANSDIETFQNYIYSMEVQVELLKRPGAGIFLVPEVWV